MITIRQPSFDDLLHVAGHLRPDDIKELSATRDLAVPAKLATSAWCAKYRYMAYLEEEPVFAFGVSVVTHNHGQVWGFGTEKTSPQIIKAVTRYGKRVIVRELLSDGMTVAQALAYPGNDLSARWLRHLGFGEKANLVGIGSGGQDLTLWVTTADEHRHRHHARAA